MKKKLTIFMLAMMNVAAIGSVKNWPVMAESGFCALFLILLATLLFFIPSALVSAELATGWPHVGGVYIWVKEAMGHRAGFLSVWLLWIQTVVWYPTALSFIAATFAYVFHPDLALHKWYLLGVMISIFWLLTWVNLKGIRIAGWISVLGVLAGNFLPAILLIGVGSYYLLSSSSPFLFSSLSLNSLWPSLDAGSLVVFTATVLSLCGIELSAVHAGDVENPKRNFPKAIALSIALILVTSLLGVLMIVASVDNKELHLASGTMQAISALFSTYHLSALVPFFGILVVIGALASLSTWIVGPSRGLLAAAQGGDLPAMFRKINKRGMPSSLLIAQASLMTLFSLCFVLMPNIDSAYWMLTVIVAQAYLLMYVLMFIAALILRYKKPQVERSFLVPGGKMGLWITCSIGALTSIFAIVLSFLPPDQVDKEYHSTYISLLLISLLFICSIPFVLYHRGTKKKLKKSYEKIS